MGQITLFQERGSWDYAKRKRASAAYGRRASEAGGSGRPRGAGGVIDVDYVVVKDSGRDPGAKAFWLGILALFGAFVLGLAIWPIAWRLAGYPLGLAGNVTSAATYLVSLVIVVALMMAVGSAKR